MKQLRYIVTAVCGILLLGSCSDFLEEYSQDTYYVTSYNDLDELLIGDGYLQVKGSHDASQTEDIGWFLPFLGDEMEEENKSYSSYNILYDTKEKVFGYYTWQQRVGLTQEYTNYITENGTWTEIYRLINVNNNVIASVKDVPQATNDEKEGAMRVNGEAHFLRGLYYFWLVNLYGKPYNAATSATDLGVPIKTDENVKDIEYQRNTVQEVYDQILSDLQVAEECLSQTTPKSTIYRADSTAVNLLLSRVYLYMQNWDKAVEYADKVIKSKPTLVNINSMEPYSGFLNKECKEIIFSMGGSDAQCNMDYAYQSFRVSHDLYNSFDDNDLRKSQWYWTMDDFVGVTKIEWGSVYEASSIDPTAEDFYRSAYQTGWEGRNCPVSDKFLFRTAEAYLNKAEAEAYLGNETEARSAVNTLRSNRYESGSDYEVTSSGETLVTAIRDERRHELAFEGHRWFDLRRYMVCEKYPYSKSITHRYTYYTARNETTMTQTNVYVLKENDPSYTLPIPQEVIEYNTGMKQNDNQWREYTTEQPEE